MKDQAQQVAKLARTYADFDDHDSKTIAFRDRHNELFRYPVSRSGQSIKIDGLPESLSNNVLEDAKIVIEFLWLLVALFGQSADGRHFLEADPAQLEEPPAGGGST